MSALRVPPGRVGRLWLRRRLEVSTLAADLLEQKLRALREEERRLTLLLQRTGEEWTRSATEADRWLLRAAVAGGDRSLRLATVAASATVTVTWRVAMGVRYPAEASCVLPARDSAVPGGAALAEAEAAYQTALQAAVRHAVAQGATQRIRREVDATRLRVRALNRNWIPRLRAALKRRELELEELEHAEGVRRRMAAVDEKTSRW
ncbi:MAG: V-type ATP synthase subunit D [Nocardioidaceae bacterium]